MSLRSSDPALRLDIVSGFRVGLHGSVQVPSLAPSLARMQGVCPGSLRTCQAQSPFQCHPHAFAFRVAVAVCADARSSRGRPQSPITLAV